METIFWSICLMGFLIWSHKLIYKNFIKSADIVVDDESQQVPAKAPSTTKQLFTIIALFLACYTFVAFTSSSTSAPVKQSQNQNADMMEAMKKFENSKEASQEKISVIPPKKVKTRLKDVAGLHEAKDEVKDIIRFLQNTHDFKRLGAKSPTGILMYGSPGNGKTLLARAIAGEAQVSFIAVSGSQFEEEYVGVGASRIRKLFELARKNAPCIIFIDEIDSVAFKRNSKQASWAAQTVNQLLTEMDGLDDKQNEGIIVLAASNRMDALDPAILRPGRFDRHIKIDYPTILEREELLDLFLARIKTDPNVNSKKVAKITNGFSGAELANLVNEAAINATKLAKNAVDLASFDVAKDRIILGSKRKTLQMTEKDRKITAYHEAGHALVGILLDQTLYKVTIAPRGPSLGHTSFESNDNEYSLSLKSLESTIASQLGGRVAEEIIFGEKGVTTGAESDLHNATRLAHSMVTKWGYSKKLGPIYQNQTLDFIPKAVIENEINLIIKESYKLAKNILENNITKLHKLAQQLLEKETLTAFDVQMIIDAAE